MATINPETFRKPLVDFVVETSEQGNHWMAHLMFTKKVLGESWKDSFYYANAFRNTPLNHEICQNLISDWVADGLL